MILAKQDQDIFKKGAATEQREVWGQEGTKGGKFQEGNKAKLFRLGYHVQKTQKLCKFVVDLDMVSLELIGKQMMSILV